jgi:hypothetical protein
MLEREKTMVAQTWQFHEDKGDIRGLLEMLLEHA